MRVYRKAQILQLLRVMVISFLGCPAQGVQRTKSAYCKEKLTVHFSLSVRMFWTQLSQPHRWLVLAGISAEGAGEHAHTAGCSAAVKTQVVGIYEV